MNLYGDEHLTHVGRGNRRLSGCIQAASLIEEFRHGRIRAGARSALPSESFDGPTGRHLRAFRESAKRVAAGR